MRKSWSVLILMAGVLIGYAVRPAPAVAQAEFHPFTLGESVRLTVDGFPAGQTTIACRVASVNNDFIQCAGEGPRRAHAVNLRYVQEITPLSER